MLLNDDVLTEKYIAYSREFHTQNPSAYVLGENTIPHISIVQTTCENDAECDAIWALIEGLKTPEISFAGLCFLPTKNDHISVETAILKSASVSDFQQQILSKIATLNSGSERQIFNGISDTFRPHITVAYSAQNDLKSMPSWPMDLLRQTGVKTALSIGLVGDHFTYTCILRRQ